MDMDSQQPNTPIGDVGGDVGEEEVEVTREELIAALQEVVTNLSNGLKGTEREEYSNADDLAQNDWFFAGVSDQPGQYAVTMWPAEGDEDMLRIDIGSEEEVHALASDPDQVAAMTDDFIDGMSEEFDEDFEDDDAEFDDEDELDEEDEEFVDEDLEDDDIDAEEDTIGRDGNRPL